MEQTFADMRNALDAIAYFGTRNEELVMRTFRSLVFRANPDARELLLIRTASIEVLRTIERETRLAVQRALAEQGHTQPAHTEPAHSQAGTPVESGQGA